MKLSRLLILAAVSTIFASCQKNTEESIVSDRRTTNVRREVQEDPQEQLFDNTLDAVHWGLVDISDNPQFVSILNAEVSKKFDGDDNVLIKTLDSACSAHGISLADSMTQSLIAHSKSNLVQCIYGAIEGFEYNGTKIYPQVFIPFVSEVNLSANPAICTNYEDDSVMDGSRIVLTGLELVSVNENFANNNLVWVISANESVDANGNLPVDTRPGANTNPPGAGRFIEAGDIQLKVTQIFMKEKKDGFANGRDDISLQAVCIRPGCSDVVNIKGEVFCKLAKSDLNDWYTVGGGGNALNILSHYFRNGSLDYWSKTKGENLYMVFYEMDRRKKFGVSLTLLPGCTDSEVHFGSKGSFYYGTYTPQYSEYLSPGPTTVVRDMTDGSFKFQGQTTY